jgi:hypothetical protein
MHATLIEMNQDAIQPDLNELKFSNHHDWIQ